MSELSEVVDVMVAILSRSFSNSAAEKFMDLVTLLKKDEIAEREYERNMPKIQASDEIREPEYQWDNM